MSFRNRLLLWWPLLIAMAIVFSVVLWPVPAETYAPQQVSQLVDRLNYNAAVITPHMSLGKKTRAENLALFTAVELGESLDAARSANYRVLYQSILKENQHYLSIFDWNLTVVLDYGMKEPNNVGSLGIPGAHDHHDFSSHSNYASLRASLAELEDPRGLPISPARVFHAASAYKDLTDILLHMATVPQTKSTPYHPRAGGDQLDQLYAGVMENFKAAQFESVNSAAYVRALHRALDSYDAMVLHIQDRLNRDLTPWERAIAGPWLSWRSLGPDLDDKEPGPFARAPAH